MSLPCSSTAMFLEAGQPKKSKCHLVDFFVIVFHPCTSRGCAMLLHLRRTSTFEIWFYSDSVIQSTAKALLASKIALRGLNRDAPKKKLDLLEFAPCSLAESRTGPAQIMRCQVRNTGFLCGVFHNVPDRLDGNAITPSLTGPIDASEDTLIFDS